MPPKTDDSPLLKPVFFLFLLTLAIRTYAISRLTDSPYFNPDERDMKFYNDWALRVMHGQWTDGYAFYGLPGYPFLMAGIYRVFGYNPFLLSGLQAVAEAFISVLIFNIANVSFGAGGNRRMGAVIGGLAAVGYAFFVPAQTFSIILMPTSLLVVVFWWVVWWSQKENASRGWLAVTGMGVLIGVMSMIVATIFFVVPLAVAGLILHRKTSPPVLVAGKIVALLAAIVLGCSPAILHNRLVAHDPVMLSAHSGLNFFVGNNSIANGYPKIPAGLRAGQSGMLKDSITIAEAAIGSNGGQPIKRSQVSAYWSAKASAYIKEHRLAWLGLEWQKIVNFWNAYQYDDLSYITAFQDEHITTPGLLFGIVSALGLAGMLTSICCFPKSRWVAAAVLLHMASLLTVFITERYRLAAVPGLLVFAAFFVVRLWQFLLDARWREAGLSVGLAAVSTFFVTQRPPDQSVWGLDSYNSGLHALKIGRLDEAEKKLSFAWRTSPKNDEINFAVGNLYLQRADNQTAKEFYRRTLEINPRHDGALNNLGFIALEQQMPAVAIEFFSLSLQVEPDDAKTNYLLAKAYFDNKQFAEAVTPLQTALRLRPDTQLFLELQTKLQAQLSTP